MKRSSAVRWPTGCVLALLLLAVAPMAQAGQPRTHDGFYLRLGLGGGSANARIEPSGGSLELSGGAFDLNMAIGGCVRENLALHATLFGWMIEDPKTEFTPSGQPTLTQTIPGTLDMTAVGVGLTWYVMPANLFFSGSVGSSSLTLEGDVDAESRDGFAAELAVGKEWWVSNSWGLGGTFAVSWFSAQDQTFLDVPDDWRGYGYTLRFTATFN